MNEFYILQNEIVFTHKNDTIPYYLLQLQKFVQYCVRTSPYPGQRVSQ